MNNLEDSVGGRVDGDVFVMEESRKERVMEREHRYGFRRIELDAGTWLAKMTQKEDTEL